MTANFLRRIHHLGFACNDIHATYEHIKQQYPIKSMSPVVFDQHQQANVCLLETNSGPHIELVSGPAVENMVAKGISLYHVCYLVEDIDFAVQGLSEQGCMLIKAAHPAPLFDGKKVAFLQTPLGLIELLESAEQDDSELQVNIAGTFNTEQLELTLQDSASDYRLPYNISSAPYNQVLASLYDVSSLFYTQQPKHNILLFRMEDNFRYQSPLSQSMEQIKRYLDKCITDFVEAIQFAGQHQVVISVYFCPPTMLYTQSIKTIISQYQEQLSKTLATLDNVLMVKHCPVPESVYLDPIADKAGHLPYTQEYNQELAQQVLRDTHAVTRRPYKVVVVDCDNTLWKGECGELKPSQLMLDNSHRQLQQRLKELSQQGLLICLCSKNHVEDVQQVFSQRSDFPLAWSDFVDYEINWEPKSQNINQLAERLNLSTDDFIFIDDNPVEIAEVAGQLPNLLALQFPSEEHEATLFLQALWCLDLPILTDSSSQRKLFYQTNRQRLALLEETQDYQAFLDSLELNVEIKAIDESVKGRIVELAQRTNQFNLNHWRVQESELMDFLAQTNTLCLQVNVHDRFGDYGLVGAVLADINDNKLSVKLFILSCRVLGKGIEYRMLHQLVVDALERQCSTISFEVIAHKKNKPALQFINQLPAERLEQSDGQVRYEADPRQLEGLSYQVKPHQPNSTQISINPQRQADNLIVKQVLTHHMSHAKQDDASTSSESLIQTIESLLNRSVSLDDNFFDIGGDSLIGVQLISKIYHQLGINLGIDKIFQYPVIKDLMSLISKMKPSAAPGEVIPRYNKPDKITSTQKFLWSLDQYHGGNIWFYNCHDTIKITGKLNYKYLEQAFLQCLQRHDILRAYYTFDDDVLRQLYHPLPDSLIEHVCVQDNHELASLLQQNYSKPFNVANDLLIRVVLYQCSDEQYYLQIVAHHLVIDGMSFGVICKDVSAFYHALITEQPANLPALEIQFSDYACWQESYLKSAQEQIDYWRNHLRELQPMFFPSDNPRHGRPKRQGKYTTIEGLEKYSPALQTVAKQYNVSVFIVSLLIYGIFVARRCQKNDIVILVPVSGRRHQNVEALVGCFINLVIMRLDIHWEQSFRDILMANRDTILAALHYQNIPFSRLLDEIDLSIYSQQSSLFQIMFGLHNNQNDKLSLDQAECEFINHHYDSAHHDLFLDLDLVGQALSGGFYYDTDIFSAESVEGFKQELLEICQQVVDQAEDIKKLERHPVADVL